LLALLQLILIVVCGCHRKPSRQKTGDSRSSSTMTTSTASRRGTLRLLSHNL
jgi:hypothetical protein